MARSRLVLVGCAVLLLLTSAGALFYTGRLRFNNPSFRRYPIRGIDVSHHQGTIDWAKLSREKVRFVFI